MPHGQHSPHAASIHILDDLSLLNVFNLYRPAIFDRADDDDVRIFGGRVWDRERWWYKLTHVCRRWRHLILGSPSFLGLCLVCTWGTPVADMLAHSPPLPIVIEYIDTNRDITAEEEESIIVALQQRDRVRRIRLRMAAPSLQKLVLAIDGEYPVLEYLILGPPVEDTCTALMLPETLQAPHLCHLLLRGFVLPMGSRLLTNATDLVMLALTVGPPSTYFRPNSLLHWLSFMPQLETLLIVFLFPVPNHEVERQLMHSPIMAAHVTLLNLRWCVFRGVSAYIEAVVSQMTAPRLEKLGIQFFKQLTFSVPPLLQFMDNTENLTRFDSVKFKFSVDKVHVEVYPSPPDEVKKYAFSIYVDSWHLDWQVFSMAQIFNSASQIFSAVEHLTLEYEEHSWSSREHDEVDRTEWRNLLRSFSKVKTLRVQDGLVKELSRCLRLDNEGPPLELLPELQELRYSGSGNSTGDAFTSFIDARQIAGRPVTLVRPNPRSVTLVPRSSRPDFSESSDVMKVSSETGVVLDT
jgi:hypothetical protein